MAIRIPYGIDPDETWELDLCAALATYAVETWEHTVARAKEKGDDAATSAAEKALDAARADLAGYEAGSGPVFKIGHIPNGKRAEIGGEAMAKARLEIGPESEKRTRAWSEEVVRWSVRGHRNLRTRAGAEVAFVSEAEKWLGVERQLVSRRTLESYQAVVDDLAILILRSQRLGETAKNG